MQFILSCQFTAANPVIINFCPSCTGKNSMIPLFRKNIFHLKPPSLLTF